MGPAEARLPCQCTKANSPPSASKSSAAIHDTFSQRALGEVPRRSLIRVGFPGERRIRMRLSPAIPASARCCDPKEVGRELRISVRRHRNASATRNGRGTQTAGHTAMRVRSTITSSPAEFSNAWCSEADHKSSRQAAAASAARRELDCCRQSGPQANTGAGH